MILKHTIVTNFAKKYLFLHLLHRFFIIQRIVFLFGMNLPEWFDK
jgi:hypothetical protein